MLAVIMTCERPNDTNYYSDTCDSIEQAGFSRDTIDDGCVPWRYGVRLGIVPTFRKAVFAALETRPRQCAIVFQDDIEAPPNLADIIENHLPAKHGVFSLYLSDGRTAPAGWSTIDDNGGYPLNVGACGIVMDAETARRFIESPPFPRVDRLGSQLVQWCWREKIPFFVHAPSLLVHRGVVSCRS